jgi:type II secretory pathway pseudopilin PulG
MSVPSLQAKHASARGYTSVEVLIAMTLLAIGAAGVIGMQRVTIQGGEDARRFDMATNIANEWLARLQKDAAFWRSQPATTPPDTMGFGTTFWLKNIDVCANKFCTIPMPPGAPDGVSPAFDVFGRDLPNGTTTAYYCVQYRLTWIAAPGVTPYAPPLRPTALMRAEVRVWWNRLEKDPIGNCAAPPAETIPVNPPFHMVYATTALRQGAPL